MDKQNIKVENYEVTSHTFLGSNSFTSNNKTFYNFKYEISLNKSTVHTQRLWQGISRGLTLYEIWETTNNPIKRWIIGKVLGFKKY